jgi:hypothetical protein
MGTGISAKRFLQQTEQASRARESNGHRPELTKDAVPFFD